MPFLTEYVVSSIGSIPGWDKGYTKYHGYTCQGLEFECVLWKQK
jgi:hypothetical protein